MLSQAVGQLGQRVGAAWGYHQRVCPKTERNVVVPVGTAVNRVKNRLFRNGGQRQRGHETGRRFSHQHLHFRACLHEQPHQQRRFVGRDRAGDSEDDFFAGKVREGHGC